MVLLQLLVDGLVLCSHPPSERAQDGHGVLVDTSDDGFLTLVVDDEDEDGGGLVP